MGDGGASLTFVLGACDLAALLKICEKKREGGRVGLGEGVRKGVSYWSQDNYS